MPSDEKNDALKFLMGIAIFLILLILGLWLCLWRYLSNGKYEWVTALGTAGDSFGVLASLFSALGFLGLIYTIIQQQKSIKQQSSMIEQQSNALTTQESTLQAQIVEMKNGLRESEAQTKQFKKTFALENNSRVIAARPDVDLTTATVKSATSQAQRSDRFILLIKMSNYGGHMRQCALDGLTFAREGQKINIEHFIIELWETRFLNIAETDSSFGEVKINFKNPDIYEFVEGDVIELELAYTNTMGHRRSLHIYFECDNVNNFRTSNLKLFSQAVDDRGDLVEIS